MEWLNRLAAVLFIPLAVLNIAGGVVSGIWLAILGKWAPIGYGIAAMFFSSFLIALILSPGILLALPAAKFHEKGNKAGVYLFGFLSSLYTMAILTAWCMAVLFFFSRYADSRASIPLLIWAYGVATGPIAYMAQKEGQGGGGDASMISSFFTQVAFVASIFVILFFRVSLVDVTLFFGAIMLLGLAAQFQLAVRLERLTAER